MFCYMLLKIQTYRNFYHNGYCFLEMEYIRGKSLHVAWHKLWLRERDRFMMHLAKDITSSMKWNCSSMLE
jgi:hypothetical protein